MKTTRRMASRVLWYESAGFLLLIALSWMDEYHESWRESAVESGAVLGVWIIVYFFTRRLVSRLYYLERFLRVCSWCKKINRDEEWIPMEQYFSEGFETEMSHGMCPECAANFEREQLLGFRQRNAGNP